SPRNLRLGVYRGGRRPLDLYYRIHDGINGTPMPAHDSLLQTQKDKDAIAKLRKESGDDFDKKNPKAKRTGNESDEESEKLDAQDELRLKKKDAYIASVVIPATEKLIAPRLWSLV